MNQGPAPSEHQSASLLADPFDRVVFISVGFTVAIAAAIWLYCRFLPANELVPTTRHMMEYVGLVHFAVGYTFFFSSPFIRPKLRNPQERTGFLGRLLACLAIGVLCFLQFPASAPLAYTLFFIHAGENSVYHIFKLSHAPSAGQPPPIRANSLFPLVVAVLLIHNFSQLFWDNAGTFTGWLQLGLVGGGLLYIRRLLPRTDWQSGSQLVTRYAGFLLLFLGVAVAFGEGTIGSDWFIIWHCVIWVVYTWVQRPAERLRLVAWHAAFAVVYKAVWLLADAHVVVFHPGFLEEFLSHRSYLSQSVLHILVTFVFRSFTMAPRPTPSAASAGR